MNIGSYKVSIDTFIIHGSRIVLILVIAFAAYMIGRAIIGHALVGVKPNSKRFQTLRGVGRGLLKYMVGFIALAMVLREFGLDPVSLVAGMGLFGVALGLGAQGIVKDAISGFTMLLEGTYSAGDFVILHLNGAPDAVGLVDEVAVRTTKITLINGASVVVPNGIIVNVTRYPLGYVPHFINIILPGDIGRKSLKSWLDDLTVDLERVSKIIVQRPRIVEPEILTDESVVARLKVHVIPSKEAEIDSVIGYIRSHYTNRFRATLPEPITSEISEGTLKKYKSVFTPVEVIS
jgi:moderate conductance mechanosensitive channel